VSETSSIIRRDLHRSVAARSAGPRSGSVTRTVALHATVGLMTREVSVRQLRNHTADVVAAVRSGERLSLTVNRRAVADIVPHRMSRDPWVPSSTLRRIVAEAGADAGLMDDLAVVRGALIDES
jgi:prevent-host-death family protein